jgi:hypothetical protein
MDKLRLGIVSNDSTKKARLLHVCNLTLVALALCTTFSAAARLPQASRADRADHTDFQSAQSVKSLAENLCYDDSLCKDSSSSHYYC